MGDNSKQMKFFNSALSISRDAEVTRVPFASSFSTIFASTIFTSAILNSVPSTFNSLIFGSITDSCLRKARAMATKLEGQARDLKISAVNVSLSMQFTIAGYSGRCSYKI